VPKPEGNRKEQRQKGIDDFISANGSNLREKIAARNLPKPCLQAIRI
jgi:hypothetical protein